MNNQHSLSKEKISILLLEGVHDSGEALFRKNGYNNIKTLKGAIDEKALIEALQDVRILGIRSRTSITKDVLEKALSNIPQKQPKLLAIGCFCIGTNQVDLSACRKWGIPVFNAPHSNTRSVAELVMAETVMLLRKLGECNQNMHKGQWIKSASGCYEVRGKTLGIIGYGHIGSQVSILAESFGMKVIFHDITTQLPMGNATQVEDLDELLENSDAITLHVPEDQGTQNLVNETFLSKMKQGSVIINASRGTVVDIEALEKSLKSDHIGGAAIDVFPIEPAKNGMPFSSPLQGIPNVILSPHIGGSTSEAQKNISLEVCQKLIQYSDIGSSMGSVNFPSITLPTQSNSHRLLHVHQNNPGILGAINQVLAESKTNIMGQYLQTFDDIGYVVIDVNQAHDTDLRKKLLEIPGTIRCRILY